jgi:hypothetical protein
MIRLQPKEIEPVFPFKTVVYDDEFPVTVKVGAVVDREAFARVAYLAHVGKGIGGAIVGRLPDVRAGDGVLVRQLGSTLVAKEEQIGADVSFTARVGHHDCAFPTWGDQQHVHVVGVGVAKAVEEKVHPVTRLPCGMPLTAIVEVTALSSLITIKGPV